MLLVDAANPLVANVTCPLEDTETPDGSAGAATACVEDALLAP
jgi:hypothetical protein